MIKAFKYRLYPNKEQTEKLQWVLRRCCDLYNAALQERKWAYVYDKKTVNYYDQSAQMTDLKEAFPEYKDIPIVVLRDPLQRVEKAMKAFFRRIKAGETPGYPRFKSKSRYDSFTYVQAGGFSLTHDSHVCLSKIGTIKVKFHRSIEGRVKTCTIKREGTQWYIVFACEVEAETLPVSYEDIGIDLGVTHFAALSDGTFIDNPRYYRKGEKTLERRQQVLSRKKRGSHRREKAKRLVVRAHHKVKNQRRDFLHKASRKLVNRYQVVVFEDLQTANLVKRPKPKQDAETGQYLPNGASAKAGLNKSINDAGWAEFVSMCTYKAAEAGRAVLQVNPKYTSQICSGCGQVRKKSLDERWHSCECGCELDRDHNAAINILRLGQSLQVQACQMVSSPGSVAMGSSG